MILRLFKNSLCIFRGRALNFYFRSYSNTKKLFVFIIHSSHQERFVELIGTSSQRSAAKEIIIRICDFVKADDGLLLKDENNKAGFGAVLAPELKDAAPLNLDVPNGLGLMPKNGERGGKRDGGLDADGRERRKRGGRKAREKEGRLEKRKVMLSGDMISSEDANKKLAAFSAGGGGLGNGGGGMGMGPGRNMTWAEWQHEQDITCLEIINAEIGRELFLDCSCPFRVLDVEQVASFRTYDRRCNLLLK